MQRVLHIGLSGNYGGVESFVMNYYRAVDKKKIQFDFILNYDKLAYQEEITALGGKIYKIADFHSHPYAYYSNLKKVMKCYKIVHIHLLSASNFLPLYAARSVGVKKIVVHAHSTRTIGILRRMLHRINRKRFKRFNAVKIACSSVAGNWMFGTKDFIIFNNAINAKQYKYNPDIRKRLRNELGIDDKEFVCGNVAAIVKEKNQIFLIKMFAELVKIYPNSKLCVVGDGVLRIELEEIVKELNLNSKVLFLSTRLDVYQLYNIFDCFILPSLFEGLPFTLVEAQANGLKCYVSRGKVSEESKIIDNMEFIDLSMGEKYWATRIFECSNKRIVDAFDIIVKRKYV